MSESQHAPVVKPLTGDAAHDHGHADHHDHGDAAHGDDHDHGGMAKYWYVFIALCALTAMSFATFHPAWPFGQNVTRTFMMAVSCTKAMLVILIFMHVLYEANWKYVLTIPAGMMSIFLILMLWPDVGLRNNWAADERENNMAHKKDLNPKKKEHGGSHAPLPATTTAPQK
jgi:cytochrome c oxidase subunit 4